MQPKSSGVPRARPAEIELSRRWAQAFLRSSSMPAIMTKSMTAHHAIPFNDCTTGAVKTKA